MAHAGVVRVRSGRARTGRSVSADICPAAASQPTAIAVQAVQRSRSLPNRPDTRARRARGRSAQRARRGAAADRGSRRRALPIASRSGAAGTCGSQSHACSDGNRKISANGSSPRRAGQRPPGRAARRSSGELLVAETGAARRKAVPRASQPSPTRTRARGRRSPASGSRASAGRRRGARRPDADQREQLEEDRHPEPEAQAGCGSCAARGATRIRRRRQRANRSTAATGTAAAPREDELDRPAADDRGCRNRRSSAVPGASAAPCVQRVHDVLGGATDLAEAGAVEPRWAVAESRSAAGRRWS